MAWLWKLEKLLEKEKIIISLIHIRKTFIIKKDGTDKAQNNKKESLIGKIFEIFWGD